MELSVAKKDLLKLVSRMQGVAERKSTMPVLSNVLLAVDGPNALRVAATDLYLSIAGKVPAEVKKGGSVAVPAKDLLERVRMMPEGSVQIVTTDGASTNIKASGSPRRYTLRGMPGDDFPPLPQAAESAPTLSLSVDVLAELMQKTYFSISTDETRAHLNSALFEWDGDTVRMVTTDGHRLSMMEQKVIGKQATATMLIPLKAVLELRRLCDELNAEGSKDQKPEITITQSGSSAFFQAGSTTFSVKLVDAQFPPYQQVIPALSDRSVRAPRVALAEALRAVSLAASDRTGGVKLSVAPGVLRITSESPESGNGFDELPVDYTGPELTIGFNAKYFLDVLDAISDEEVILGISGELDPAVVRPASESSEQSYVAVIMPMRI